MAVMSASFHNDGHVPLTRDFVKIMYKGVHSSYERCLRTSEGIPSGLRLYLLGNIHINFLTFSGDMLTSGSVLSVRLSNSGRYSLSSVKTGESIIQ